MSSDTHLHSQLSSDSSDTFELKVAALAAEHIEIPVSTEHEALGDFGPAIAALGLTQFLKGIVGTEVTTSNIGHFNAFPLEPDLSLPNHGRLEWFGMQPAELFARIRANPGDPIVTLAADALDGDLDQPSVVKCVLDRRGYALYFSRAAIPFPRLPGGAAPLRHLGIYGYQRQALLDLAALPQTPLEKSESLEQLRALENGIRIRVLTGARPSWGVDTIEDAEAVDRRLREEIPQDPGSPPYLDRGER